MREAKTPQGDIPLLYSSAANTQYDRKTRMEYSAKLAELYKDYILAVAKNLQEEYQTRIELEELTQEGVVGLLESLRSLELNNECRTYAAWIEKNIQRAIRGRISAELKTPGSEGWPNG